MADSQTRVVVKELVRFSYAHVLEPSKGMDDSKEEKYSVSVLIPKTAKATLKKISDAIAAAKEQGKEKKWGGKIPGGLKTPVRDGDEDRPDDPAYAGMYFLNASSKRKPQVIDRDGNIITDPMEFYSGCWGGISLNFFPYSSNGNKGVGAGLGNIIKLKDDESLGGGATRAEDDFGDLIEAGGASDDSDDGAYDFG